MGEKLLEQSKKYKAQHTNKKRRKKIFSILVCVIVFCTVYALLLPATTMEKTSYCGNEAHTHSDKCYTKELVCTLQEDEVMTAHVHSDACYSQERKLICQTAESAGHVHTAECKQVETTLICGIEESESHVHSDSCYMVTEKYVCGMEETTGHTHSDACYEMTNVLNCGLEECAESSTTHKHTDECYEKKMTCELEEHEHELICYSDKNADLETRADWEATLPGKLSGVWAEDVLAVAKSQLGYAESSKNYDVTADGRTLGYTRYGAWYGDPYGDWCAMFVSFCMDYADVDTDKIPLDANCQNWIRTLSKEEYGLYHKAEEYTPAPGDLVFFDWNQDGRAQHVGVVVENIPAAESESAKIRTIEGNCYDNVQYMTYEVNDESILGYGELPENPDNRENTEEVSDEQTIAAVIYTDETCSVIAEDDNTVITVSGNLPEGVTARAYPVQLEEDSIEGKKVILAYDITIYDAEGNLIETDASDAPMTVTIQPAEWDNEDKNSDSDNYTIYYLPEEGEPEAMDTDSDENAVSFQTDHFSVYVLTVSGTMDTVYVNGTSGNDTAAGTQNAPVKTFEKAFSLLNKNGTVYVSGTVTISDEQEWNLAGEGATIKRVTSFTGPLITVANGGSLTVANITINGGCGTPSASKIATNTSYASPKAKAPLVVVNTGGNLVINDGAVLEYNSNEPNILNNVFSESGYIGQGGAVYCNGSLTMNGGTIQYCEAQSGGGIYVENGTFDLTGGTIDHNYARDITDDSYRTTYHKNAGGGVYVGDHATMNMSGGVISNNQTSREGGGISLGWLNRSKGAAIDEFITTFNMTGGIITGNTATSTGGGLNITAGRQAYISAGTFTNNTANGMEYQDDPTRYSLPTNVYSGGAIYLDAQQLDGNGRYAGKPGYAVINRVLITDNEAKNYGGGIATCATSTTSVNASVDLRNGTAIYNNTGKNGNEMALSGSTLNVGSTVLGGGAYNWEKDRSEVYYDNSLIDSSNAIIEAKKLATVIISGNYGLYGGGIGCNGVIEIGGETKTESISITKIWNDDGTVEHPDYIIVQILQDGEAYGDPVKIYRTTDSDGNEAWPTYYLDGLPEGHTYAISEVEVPGFTSTITKDGNHFTVTNTPEGFQVVKKWVDDTEKDRPESIEVQLYQNDIAYGNAVKLTKDNNWSYLWINLPEADEDGNAYTYTAKEVNIPEGYYSTSNGGLNEEGVWEITNTKSPVTSVSVEKRWADGVVGADSVTVQLLANGELYGESVILNSENSWFYKWEDLPTLDKGGNEVIYEVQETPVAGYTTDVTQGDTSIKQYTWTVDESFSSGTQYLLVSSQGALADNGNGGLMWVNVSQTLTSGTSPDSSVLWTAGSNGTSTVLTSGSGNCLALSSGKFVTSNQGSTINYGEQKIWNESGNSFRRTYYYFTGISDTKGTSSNKSDDAMTFTLYKFSDTTPDWGDAHFVITNTKKAGIISVNFAKYATGNGEPTLLAGAKLELYQQGDSESVVPGTDVTGTLIGRWTSENATSASGGIQTIELTSGTYYLLETEVPEGHAGLSGPIIFQVNAETGTVSVIQYPGYDNIEFETSGDGTVEVPVYNEIIYGLPETGGMGTTVFYVVGAILVLGAVVVMIAGKRKNTK